MSDKKITLKEEVLKLSTAIRAELSVDKQTGLVTGDSKKVYNENLPEGITEETVKSISDYNTTFVAGATHAVGEMAIDAMKANSNLERVSAELGFGYKDTLDLAVDRRVEIKNHLIKDENGEPTTSVKYGSTKFGMNVHSSHNAGQLKAARNLINQMAEEALKK